MKASNLTFSSHGTVLTSMRFRILVADDDTEFRQLVTTVLEGDGYEVQQAANGRQLLDLLASWYDLGLLDASCHLIISDVRMPGYSGLDVLASLHGLGSRIPVIVITAFGDDDTRFLAAGLGAVAFLAKPFDMDDLRTVVLNVVTNARAQSLSAPNFKN